MKNTNRYVLEGKYSKQVSDDFLIGDIGFGEPVVVNRAVKKRVLVTGEGSYIGESFERYASEHYKENLSIDTIDMIDGTWRETDFSGYDIVYHVAGIAHADIGNVNEETKQKYYMVNTELAVEVAKKAKKAGVKTFVFMSSIIVYGDSEPYGNKKVITESTVPSPANFYGDSKLQADVGVRLLADESYKVIVIRPPMIYGKGSKGNYPMLAKIANKFSVFPDVDNERSMLHINNLCEFICQIMLIDSYKNNAVVLMPQNREWSKTADMVREIAQVCGKKIRLMRSMKVMVVIGGKMPGKIGQLVNKAFGNCCYEQKMSEYDGVDYRVINLKDSIRVTEG